jgi:hypothetical protein
MPGATGLVFQAGDVTALREALVHALSDRIRLARWGVAAREHVRGFGYEQTTQGLLRALRETCGA